MADSSPPPSPSSSTCPEPGGRPAGGPPGPATGPSARGLRRRPLGPGDRAVAQAQFARTDLTGAERRQEAIEIKARHIVEAAADGAGAGGVEDFFENVGAEEIDLLTPFLTATIAAVQTHHDGLPA
ncbi:hypothetical protein [Hymenobacter sp.]|uniref:hypothetical protein n=1 Tax=Hymenobacter sp. TaxID=1898978 RepID=UPI00286B9D35|nr:hypothetical protein [Hymenobacter sp.]